MYKYVPNSVAKISMMFAKDFEYYTIILRRVAFCGHAVDQVNRHAMYIMYSITLINAKAVYHSLDVIILQTSSNKSSRRLFSITSINRSMTLFAVFDTNTDRYFQIQIQIQQLFLLRPLQSDRWRITEVS